MKDYLVCLTLQTYIFPTDYVYLFAPEEILSDLISFVLKMLLVTCNFGDYSNGHRKALKALVV